MRPSGVGKPLSSNGGNAWLRRTYRLGRGDDNGWFWIGGARMTTGIACGSVRHWTSSERQVLRRVRCPDRGVGGHREVQAGDGAVRRCGAFDEPRGHLDAERLRDIMTEVAERSAAVVRRYGGTVEFTGDGVMALFGAPVALEDHAFRACLAAVAIQEDARPVGSRGAAPRRGGATPAGGLGFGPGDRRRDRFGLIGLRRDR